MWPLAFIALGVLWYLKDRKPGPSPDLAKPAAPPPASTAARDAEWMKVLEGMAPPQEEGAPADGGSGGSGGSGGGGGYADGGDQISITSPVNPATQPAAAPAPVGQRVTIPAAQAKLETTSAQQMATRLQAPMGSIAKRRVL